MYKDLDKMRSRQKVYAKEYRERKATEAKSRQEENRKKIAAAIIVAELTQKFQEPNGRELGRHSQANNTWLRGRGYDS